MHDIPKKDLYGDDALFGGDIFDDSDDGENRFSCDDLPVEGMQPLPLGVLDPRIQQAIEDSRRLKNPMILLSEIDSIMIENSRKMTNLLPAPTGEAGELDGTMDDLSDKIDDLA